MVYGRLDIVPSNHFPNRRAAPGCLLCTRRAYSAAALSTADFVDGFADTADGRRCPSRAHWLTVSLLYVKTGVSVQGWKIVMWEKDEKRDTVS